MVALGGGRRAPGAAIDPAVGLAEVRGLGEAVQRGEALAIVHARNVGDAERASVQVRAAFAVGEVAPAAVPAWHWL